MEDVENDNFYGAPAVNLMRKAMRKKIKWVIFLLVLILYTVVFILIFKDSNPSINFFRKSNESILPIEYSGYNYKDFKIYKIAVIENNSIYTPFLNSGYFALKNGIVYGLFIDKRFEMNYKTGNYFIDVDYSRQSSVDSKVCNIDFETFIDLKRSVNDTTFIFNTQNDWTILKAKFFDISQNDTVYIFEKKQNIQKYNGFSFSKTNGFLGLFKLEKDLTTFNLNQDTSKVIKINNAFGKIYENKLKVLYPEAKIQFIDSINFVFRNVDLSLIKEFTKD